MTRTTTLLALGLLTYAALPVSHVAASNYPPDYQFCSAVDTVHDGPFEIIKETYNPSGDARLAVAYRGYLRDSYADEDITVWISLNGNDAFVPASSGSFDDAYVYFDSGPRNCVYCSPGFPGNPTACDDHEIAPSGGWYCEWPTSTEDHLFFWAYDQWGNQNAWDIEVAAEAGGQWDSNWGGNYHAHFEARNSCW